MRRILYDLLLSQPMGGSKFHGGGEYMKKVFRELLMTKPDDMELVVYYDHDRFLDDWLQEMIKENNVRSYDIKEISGIREVFDKEQFDVFYTGQPYEYRSEFFPHGVYKIGTFHGMRVVECPHDWYEYKYAESVFGVVKERVRNLLKNTRLGYERSRQKALMHYEKCIRCFDKLVCDSDHSAYSLLVYYPWLKQGEVEVCFLPLKYSTSIDTEKLMGEKYILLLGGNRWIKNAYRGIKAIDVLDTRGYLKDVKTVVVGGLNRQIQSEVKNKRQFVIKGYVDDSELNSLYRYCSVLLYPTLNEGFGYPPLEAMRFGRTCIVSAVCSLPEVCGEAVYYVNPYDLGEIQNRILWAIHEPIPEERIRAQFEKVSERQKSDLKKLVDLIVGGDGVG